MVERIEAYSEKGQLVRPGPKSEIIGYQREWALRRGDSPFAVPVVYLLMVNPVLSDIYLTRRADKKENPFLLCKPVGGHIKIGEAPDKALIRETKEELGIPIELAGSYDDFLRMREGNYTFNGTARGVKIHMDPWFGAYRVEENGGRWLKRTRAHIYIGEYSGDFNLTTQTDPSLQDGLGEVLSIIEAPLDQLWGYISTGDPRFTHDLHVLLRSYGIFLKTLLPRDPKL